MRPVAMVLTILILGSLTVGQTCGPQTYPPLTEVPFAYDVNEVALDVQGGQRLLLTWATTLVGRQVVLYGYACDPDGDEFGLTASAGTLHSTRDPNTAVTVYDIAYTPQRAGVHYIHVTAMDAFGETRTGTHVVQARTNTPPTLCGGLPR